MRRKLTAADRPEFRRQVAELVQQLGIEQGAIGPDVMVVCTRAADFDPGQNVLWELEANRSAVRPDVLCCACQSPLAMSNDAYGRYRALDRKPKVCCLQCMPGIVEREGPA